LFEHSTRKYKWESYDGQAKFLDDLKGMQVIAQKSGYGPQYIDLFAINNGRRTCVSLLDNTVFVTQSVLGGKNGGWRDRRRQRSRGQGRLQWRKEYRCRSNDHVDALCASESLEALFFSLHAFKCNIIALVTFLHFIHEGIRCSREHATEVAYA
jgi:hypothetical protein